MIFILSLFISFILAPDRHRACSHSDNHALCNFSLPPFEGVSFLQVLINLRMVYYPEVTLYPSCPDSLRMHDLINL